MLDSDELLPTPASGAIATPLYYYFIAQEAPRLTCVRSLGGPGWGHGSHTRHTKTKGSKWSTHEQIFCCDGWTSSKVTAERHSRTKEVAKSEGLWLTPRWAVVTLSTLPITNKKTAYPTTNYAEREWSHPVFAEKQQLQLVQLKKKQQVLTAC